MFFVAIDLKFIMKVIRSIIKSMLILIMEVQIIWK